MPEAFYRGRKPLLIVLALAFAFMAVSRLGRSVHASGPATSLAAYLAPGGLSVDARSVHWLSQAGLPGGGQTAVFVARRSGELADVFVASVRRTRAGGVYGVSHTVNLTHTRSAAEHLLAVRGSEVLIAAKVGDAYEAVTLLDLGGESPELTAHWPPRSKVQNALTNLQDTGRWRGIGRQRYRLAQPATSLRARNVGSRFLIEADGKRIVLEDGYALPVQGAQHVEVRPVDKAVPGTLTWVVDSVRRLSFVGPEPIAWLEHRVFGWRDWAERTWHQLASTSDDTAGEVARDFGLSLEQSRRRLRLAAKGPAIGWRPAALDTILKPSKEGEGEWIPVVGDPFLKPYPNAPAAFHQTFLRVDEERPYVRVYIVGWDPRQVQLHIMSGTREPESATGETGEGMVPRADLERLVAGFNGGFQALHGEFGMMSGKRTYLPPKPWAATVAVMDDGVVAIGSWLPPPKGASEYREAWARAQIPDRMLSFRQNLTSVVEDGVYNPWRRWYWGAAPLRSEEQTFIDRSGLCLTDAGHLIYFWGQSMGPEQLGAAMLKARCKRGMHLDMNSRHTGFEFYRVQRDTEPFEPLGRELEEDEFEGPVPHAQSLHARVRKAVRRMSPLRFPRYFGRDTRDFFFLLQKATLPGPDVDGVPFSSAGLPHSGWPPAMARAFFGNPERGGTWLVRMDPARLIAAADTPPDGSPLAYLTMRPDSTQAASAGPQAAAGAGTDLALYLQVGNGARRAGVGRLPRGARALAFGSKLAAVPHARTAFGVDRDGFVVYAEVDGEDEQSLSKRLMRAGVSEAIALPKGTGLVFALDGGVVGPDAYERSFDPQHALPLYGLAEPVTELLFPQVRPRPYGVWAKMQDTRVRYFKPEVAPRFRRPAEDAGVEAGSAR